MHLDGGPLDPILSEEGGDLDALISLELNNLTHLLVFDESAVTCKFLIHGVSYRFSG